MNDKLIITVGLIVLFSAVLSQIVFSLHKKRQRIIESWQNIANHWRDLIDRLPYLMELINHHPGADKAAIKKHISVRGQLWLSSFTPKTATKLTPSLDESLADLIKIAAQNLKNDQSFLDLEKELNILHHTFQLEQKAYNQAVDSFNRLRLIIFFSPLFNVKPLDKI